VRSAQQGAQVHLDGIPTGQGTPALLKDVSAGEPHKVHVEITIEGKKLVGDDVVTIPSRGETLDVTIPLR
jgi:hypothetical protein